MIKVTITSKDGKRTQKSFRNPQRAVAFISSFGSDSMSRPTKRAADLGGTHAFKNDVCEYCGGGVEVAFQPCPNR